MNDQLIYEVFLKLSEQGVRDVSAEVDKLAKSFDDAFKKAGGVQKAVDESGKLVDVIESVNNAVQNQIKTDVQAQKVLEEKRKELAEVNKAIRTSAEVSEADAAKKLQLTGEIRELNGALSAAQKETSILNAAQNANINTYQGLVDANKALMVEMRNVPLDDTTGRLEKLQGQYKANNDRLKTFDATLGNHQRNVGNYREGMEQAIRGLGNLPGPLGGAISGFASFNTVLKANPIGAVIQVVTMLISRFAMLQPITDQINRVFGVMSVVFQQVIDRIGFLAVAAGRLLKGDFSGAAEAARNATENFGRSIIDTARNANQLEKDLVALRKAEIDNIEVTAELTRQREAAREAAMDESKSIEERIELTRRAINATRASFENEIELARERARILTEQSNLASSTDAELKAAAEARARVAELEAGASRQVIELQSRLNTLVRQNAAELGRAEQEFMRALRITSEEIPDIALDLDISDIEAQQKFLTDAFLAGERLRTQAQINELRNRGELVRAVELEQETAFNAFRASALATGLTDEAQIRAAFRQQELQFEQQKIDAQDEMERRALNMRVGLAMSGFRQISAIGQAFFGNNKALAIATATVDAIGAAISAANNTKGGFIAKSLAAAAQLAQGFAQIRQMQSVKIGQAGTGSTISGAIPSAPTGNQPAPPAEIESFRAAVNLTNGSGAPTAPNIVINADRDGFTAYVNDGQTDITNRSLVLTNDI
jgi:hypothetical protein